MIFNQVNLAIDLKCQDRLRRWFSQRGVGASNNLEISCLGLGDSDIDYELSQQADNIYVLHSPFEVPGIKHKIIYAGNLSNLSSTVTCYLRQLYDDTIYFDSESGHSYWVWSASEDVATSLIVATPTFDWSNIPFEETNALQDGYILYFQTLPTGYLVGGVQGRYPEQYDFTFANVPGSWEIIIDEVYGSLLIAKPAAYTFTSSSATITAKGKQTGAIKVVTFNI